MKWIDFYTFSSLLLRMARGDLPKLARQKWEKLDKDSKPYL